MKKKNWKPQDWKLILKDYIEYCAPERKKHLSLFGKIRHLPSKQLVRRAAVEDLINGETVHPHQRRIGREKLRKFAEKIAASRAVQTARTYEAIHAGISDLILRALGRRIASTL